MSDDSSADKNSPETERLRDLRDQIRVGADRIARKKGELDRSLRRFGFMTKVSLLRFRYICGYLAAGFTVSAPMYMSLRFWYQGNLTSEFATELWEPVRNSVLLGVTFLLPYLLLAPITKISWENMRVPEFQKFELSLSKAATIFSIVYFVICLGVSWLAGDFQYSAFFDPRPAWMNFLIQLVPFLRLKALTVLFREYYTSSVKKEDLVLRPRSDTIRVATPKELAPSPDTPAVTTSTAPSADDVKTEAVEEAEAEEQAEEQAEEETPAETPPTEDADADEDEDAGTEKDEDTPAEEERAAASEAPPAEAPAADPAAAEADEAEAAPAPKKKKKKKRKKKKAKAASAEGAAPSDGS